MESSTDSHESNDGYDNHRFSKARNFALRKNKRMYKSNILLKNFRILFEKNIGLFEKILKFYQVLKSLLGSQTYRTQYLRFPTV